MKTTNKNAYEKTIAANRRAYSAIKRQSPERFDGVDELDVWFEYSTAPNEKIKDAAQEELLWRHNAMLSKIAHHMKQYYSQLADFEDFLSMARNGAIIAYGRYNPYKKVYTTNENGEVEEGEVAALSTFVHKTVEQYILSCIDEESFIHCPAQKRGHRAYFKGRYDTNPEKKAKFEEKHGLTSPEAIAQAREKYELLNAQVFSFDTHWENEDGEERTDDFGAMFEDEKAETSDQILTRLEIEKTVGSFNDLQKQVFTCVFVEQNTVRDTAEILEVSEKDVQDCIKQVRATFRRRHPDLAAGRSKHNRKNAA